MAGCTHCETGMDRGRDCRFRNGHRLALISNAALSAVGPAAAAANEGPAMQV